MCLEERSRSDFLKCSESGKQVFFQKITLHMRALYQVLLLLRRIIYNNKESCGVLKGFFSGPGIRVFKSDEGWRL